MKVLHIDSSATGAMSVTRELTAATVYQLQEIHPGATVTYRDLVEAPPAHLDDKLLAALRPQKGYVAPESLRAELALTETMLCEFLAADVVVIGAPMYNFSVPTQLKAWIDRIAQAGRTFRYTAQGPEGLIVGKKMIIVSSRGGMYAGAAFETAMDHQEAYLRAVMGFFGISDITVIRAEGIAMGADARALALGKALNQTKECA
ncbi:FMN-dependent NADH-azoreductase [Herminiimonas sp. CN]|uniref:FMN-dependent NADH-azoreductase n=1 Tax=Herminiimonas sp. CN TaxID=1349818 RepID=UPI00047346F4|nr:FMN-dependent NADH-azoreductase [Herminiimonas sp. CN]